MLKGKKSTWKLIPAHQEEGQSSPTEATAAGPHQPQPPQGPWAAHQLPPCHLARGGPRMACVRRREEAALHCKKAARLHMQWAGKSSTTLCCALVSWIAFQKWLFLRKNKPGPSQSVAVSDVTYEAGPTLPKFGLLRGAQNVQCVEPVLGLLQERLTVSVLPPLALPGQYSYRKLD